MKFKKPRGTYDLYFENMFFFNEIENILKKIAIKYNFSEIRTPIFEEKELFIKTIGNETDIVNKEIFELINNNNNKFILRPEGTASVARAVIENKLFKKYNLPLKFFYLGNMFRHERPQKNRFRQFCQFGIEAIGINNILFDFEIILLINEIIDFFNLKNIILKWNILINNNKREKYIDDLKKYLLNKKICNLCEIRLIKNPLRILDCKNDNYKFNNFPKMFNYLNNEEKNYFNNFKKYLEKYNINYIFDHKLVRGLEYYNSLVFEFVLIDKNEKELSILGGGKYNNLFNLLKNDIKIDLPSIGFSIGIERLLYIIKNNKNNFLEKKYKNKKIDLYLICLSENAREYAYNNLLIILRKENYKIEINYNNLNLKKQFNFVKKLKANFAIIIGDNEIKNNFIIIKNQKTGIQNKIKLNEILFFLNNERNK